MLRFRERSYIQQLIIFWEEFLNALPEQQEVKDELTVQKTCLGAYSTENVFTEITGIVMHTKYI